MQQQQQAPKGTDIVIQGRIVWGGVKPQVKRNFQTKQPVVDAQGKEIIEYAFGLAIPKPNPQSSREEVENFTKWWNAIHQEAAKIGVNQGNTAFHWKYDDGDGRKADGSPYPEHSRGHMVIVCKTQLPLKLMVWDNGTPRQAIEDEIKCGYYVQVALNISAHAGVNAGLYINPSFVARFAFGSEIVNMPDPTTVLGNTPPPMFAGASATPVAPVGAMPGMGTNQMGANNFGQPPQFPNQQGPGGFNGGQQPGGGQFNQNVPAYAAPQAPANPGYQPNHQVLPNQFQQPQYGNNGVNSPGTGGNGAGGFQSPQGNVPYPNGMNPAQPVVNQHQQMGYNPATNVGQPQNTMAPNGQQFAMPGYGYNGQ